MNPHSEILFNISCIKESAKVLSLILDEMEKETNHHEAPPTLAVIKTQKDIVDTYIRLVQKQRSLFHQLQTRRVDSLAESRKLVLAKTTRADYRDISSFVTHPLAAGVVVFVDMNALVLDTHANEVGRIHKSELLRGYSEEIDRFSEPNLHVIGVNYAGSMIVGISCDCARADVCDHNRNQLLFYSLPKKDSPSEYLYDIKLELRPDQFQPTLVCQDPKTQNLIVVNDIRTSSTAPQNIQIYSDDGKFIKEFGQITLAHGGGYRIKLAVVNDVLVVLYKSAYDYRDSQIIIYDLEGTKKATLEHVGFAREFRDFAVTRFGTIAVLNEKSVTTYEVDGKIIAILSTDEELGKHSTIAVDNDCNVLICSGHWLRPGATRVFV
jgi:hypothetical protein